MNLVFYVCLTLLLFSVELLYLRLARHFSLFDVPNKRSLHTRQTTVRGGGIIVYVAVLSSFLLGTFGQLYFLIGITIVALISFADDLYSIPKRNRLVAQFIAVGLLLAQAEIFPSYWWVVAGLLVVGVGILNAYNFMDGINGMTAFYSLVTIGTLWRWQPAILSETTHAVLPAIFISLLIFSYFNARSRAICFAGDVGSISIGFIIVYFLLNRINQFHTYLPLLLLAVYGTDSVLTILNRLYLRQNIFQAHRLHLFQLLVHKLGWPHLLVAALYAIVQTGINGLVLTAMSWPPRSQLILSILVVSCLAGIYVVLKTRLTTA